MILNPYKIVWSVEIKKNGEVKFKHFKNKEALKKNLKAKKGSVVYVITDKQFGMIQNSWDGIEKEVAKPFKNKLVAKDGNCIQTIPVTKKQLDNPIYV